MSKENDKKLLEQLKSGFKRTVKWNKYRSQMTVQSNNNNLNYLIDPTFTKVNKFLVLSFERIEENNAKKDHRDSFSRYYVANVEIIGFNVLIDGKSFFDLPVKNDEEIYEKTMSMSRNNDHTTGNLLDFACFKKHYRLIAIDLSKQTKFKDPQQINFIGKWSNSVFQHLIKMETQKIVKLLNSSENVFSKFATTKNGTLLTMKQRVAIHTKIQSNFNKLNRIKSL